MSTQQPNFISKRVDATVVEGLRRRAIKLLWNIAGHGFLVILALVFIEYVAVQLAWVYVGSLADTTAVAGTAPQPFHQAIYQNLQTRWQQQDAVNQQLSNQPFKNPFQ